MRDPMAPNRVIKTIARDSWGFRTPLANDSVLVVPPPADADFATPYYFEEPKQSAIGTVARLYESLTNLPQNP
jgi:hypothetical protein